MKLLLIGWDAADWSTVRRLLERGSLPRLQLLLSEAATGELQPVRPFDATALWTSLVTGKRAMSHGVLGPVEVVPCRRRIRPTSRAARTARAVWSILSDAGYRTHAFGWPASHPAEPIQGVAVSDQFAEFGDEDSIYPRRLLDRLRALRLSPTEIDAASLVTLLPRAGELNPVADQRLYAVAQFLASTASLHAAATWALEHEPWDFAAVRYAGLAHLVHVFGPACETAIQKAPSGEVAAATDDAELFGSLIPNAYRFFDMLLQRLLELAGSEASVMLVSEQGWVPQPPGVKTRRLRPEPGIVIATGSAFKPRRQLDDAGICDVAPTILRLFGLCPESGSHGRAWQEVLSKVTSAPPPSNIERPDLSEAPSSERLSEERLREGDSPHFASETSSSMPTPSKMGTVPDTFRIPSEPPLSSENDPEDESVAHLLSLGYREPPDEFLRFAVEQLEQEREWRLAEAWIDSRQYEPAAGVLESLVQREPTSILYRSMLAEAYFRAGQYEACRRTIKALQNDGLDTALGQLGLAAVASLDSDVAKAVEHLQRAEAMPEASAGVLDMVGQLYLRLHRSSDAARVFDAAIAQDSALGTAHEGRSIASLDAGDLPAAERHAREAVRLNPHSYEAQYHLGLALERQNRSDEAIEVLRTATLLDPRGGASAHRHLADLLEHRGEAALAFHHRALADRRGAHVKRAGW